MFFSRFFSRISLSSRRNFTTSIFNMAPQHRQVAVIGSGPAGKYSSDVDVGVMAPGKKS